MTSYIQGSYNGEQEIVLGCTIVNSIGSSL